MCIRDSCYSQPYLNYYSRKSLSCFCVLGEILSVRLVGLCVGVLVVPRPDRAYLTSGQGGGWDPPAAAGPRWSTSSAFRDRHPVRCLLRANLPRPVREPHRDRLPHAGAPTRGERDPGGRRTCVWDGKGQDGQDRQGREFESFSCPVLFPVCQYLIPLLSRARPGGKGD